MKKLTLISSIIITIISKVYNREFDDEEPVPEVSSFCPQVQNCLFYQVNKNMTNYGCSVCSKEFMIHSDSSGIGNCTMRNTFKNCRGSQKRPDMNSGEPYCFECERDFSLRNDSMGCNPVPETQRIKNCRDYFMSNNTFMCNVCDPGYSLEEDKKTCTEGCRLNNCESCQIINGKTQCFNCYPKSIGVIDPETLIYTRCLSCDEYEYTLKALNSSYVPPNFS